MDIDLAHIDTVEGNPAGNDIVVLLGTGSLFVFSQKMTIGSLIAILSITTTIFPSIASLAFANISLQGAKVAFDRMFEFTSLEPEYQANPKSEKEYLSDFKILEIKKKHSFIIFHFVFREENKFLKT